MKTQIDLIAAYSRARRNAWAKLNNGDPNAKLPPEDYRHTVHARIMEGQFHRLAGAFFLAAVNHQHFGGGFRVRHDAFHPPADPGQAIHLAGLVHAHLPRGAVAQTAHVRSAGAGKHQLRRGLAGALRLGVHCVHQFLLLVVRLRRGVN
jgi:hypothetical protein